jgi:hypothetical protein
MTLSDSSLPGVASQPSRQVAPRTTGQLADLLRRSMREALATAQPPDRVWRRISGALQESQRCGVPQLAEKAFLE